MEQRIQNARAVKRALSTYGAVEKARGTARFFKVGPGEYAEGDQFIGATMPEQRAIAKKYIGLPFDALAKLLASPIHEHRLTALIVLVYRYEQATRQAVRKQQQEVVRFYLAHIDTVNNWDLVDSSAPQILGAYYHEYGGEQKLYTFAKSKSLWRRRISIVATHTFIRAGELAHTFAIATVLLSDPEDLMHKAVGWMLREAGKKDTNALKAFLECHAHTMPRTMLRYAIEKYEPHERKKWLGRKDL